MNIIISGLIMIAVGMLVVWIVCKICEQFGE
ncbi:hypothetical protein UFOVP328_364 [uncultured Caudovirales phage]|uniref:Uncharacterized protein n=1 Tax=uncultured Caudovirales phage TaxID=2100421 RepID=A0A6J5LVR9_9CAUD|nr:hypothetical protein UFOVP328_364 [uncultured Caudovirales phage]